jgi:hypothetical protein
MTDTQTTQDLGTEVSADVQAERARVAREVMAWAASRGYDSYATQALRAAGLGDHLPRTTAEVFVHVTGTVTVRCGADGSWTQEAALRALEQAVYAGRAVVEASEVEPTGAPGAE